jgi:hypothetical protein
MTQIKTIAFYLPQFHPTPENDKWWGPGFTEWTNVAQASPLFSGHDQPDIPADLGFYDLRLDETREAQVRLAKQHGIHGFCYWHYWFAGKTMLDRPFNDVLSSGKPDFPFCLAWANHTWSRIWQGRNKDILVEQTYPGLEDHKNHFYSLLEAFKDDRYIKVDGKPLFLIFDPLNLPESKVTLDYWRELALSSGLEGLYIIAILEDVLPEDIKDWNPITHGFDAITISNQTAIAHVKAQNNSLKNKLKKLLHKLPYFRKKPFHIYKYKDALPYFLPSLSTSTEHYPCIIPNWDNTPRHGQRGVVLHDACPELFRLQVKESIHRVLNKKNEHNIIFIKSWNEWAEGNYLEPSIKHGRGFLNAIKKELDELNSNPEYLNNKSVYPTLEHKLSKSLTDKLVNTFNKYIRWRF